MKSTMTSSHAFANNPAYSSMIKPGNGRVAKLSLFQYLHSLLFLIIITCKSPTLLLKLCYVGMVSMLLHLTSKGRKKKSQHEPIADEQKLLNLHAP